jgi:hypothetical protein
MVVRWLKSKERPMLTLTPAVNMLGLIVIEALSQAIALVFS